MLVSEIRNSKFSASKDRSSAEEGAGCINRRRGALATCVRQAPAGAGVGRSLRCLSVCPLPPRGGAWRTGAGYSKCAGALPRYPWIYFAPSPPAAPRPVTAAPARSIYGLAPWGAPVVQIPQGVYTCGSLSVAPASLGAPFHSRFPILVFFLPAALVPAARFTRRASTWAPLLPAPWPLFSACHICLLFCGASALG